MCRAGITDPPGRPHTWHTYAACGVASDGFATWLLALHHNLLPLFLFAGAQGLEWVAKNHIKPAIVHMSIEGGYSSLVNKAVDQLIKTRHMHVVVSAGEWPAVS